MARGTVYRVVYGPRGSIYSATDGLGWGPTILLWMVRGNRWGVGNHLYSMTLLVGNFFEAKI